MLGEMDTAATSLLLPHRVGGVCSADVASQTDGYCHEEKRRKLTHRSRTHSDARLVCRGKGKKPSSPTLAHPDLRPERHHRGCGRSPGLHAGANGGRSFHAPRNAAGRGPEGISMGSSNDGLMWRAILHTPTYRVWALTVDALLAFREQEYTLAKFMCVYYDSAPRRSCYG